MTMNSTIKTTFIALILTAVSALHAETEKEFGERVAKAWNSKQAANILALYSDLDSLDPNLKQSLTSMIEFQIKKGFERAEFTLLPHTGPKKPIFLNKAMGYSMNEFAGEISLDFGSGWGSTKSPYTKKSDGSFALAVPTTKKIEWSGDEMANFQVSIRPEKDASYIPSAVVVLERYGRIDFEVITGNLSFRTHKIQSVIIPSTPDSGSMILEISQGMENVVFKKSVDTTKGAIITAELQGAKQ
jgi:hypothetical protein